MHRLLRCAAATAILAALAVPAASAAPPIPVAGSLAPGQGTTLVPTPAGDNLKFDAVGTHIYTGSLVGTSTIEVHFVIHDLTTITYQGFSTFTGMTPCGPATFRTVESGSGAFPGPLYGHSTIVDQADSTTTIHGDLDTIGFLTPVGAFVTYTGTVRCG